MKCLFYFLFFSPLQLFDEDNPLHKSDNKYIFTTEGHVVPVDQRFRDKQWDDPFPCTEGALTNPYTRPAPTNTSNVRLPPPTPTDQLHLCVISSIADFKNNLT